jgi:hypothetical protein
MESQPRLEGKRILLARYTDRDDSSRHLPFVAEGGRGGSGFWRSAISCGAVRAAGIPGPGCRSRYRRGVRLTLGKVADARNRRKSWLPFALYITKVTACADAETFYRHARGAV